MQRCQGVNILTLTLLGNITQPKSCLQPARSSPATCNSGRLCCWERQCIDTAAVLTLKCLIAVKIKPKTEQISAAPLQPASAEGLRGSGSSVAACLCFLFERFEVNKLPADQNCSVKEDMEADYHQRWRLSSFCRSSTAPLSVSAARRTYASVKHKRPLVPLAINIPSNGIFILCYILQLFAHRNCSIFFFSLALPEKNGTIRAESLRWKAQIFTA